MSVLRHIVRDAAMCGGSMSRWRGGRDRPSKAFGHGRLRTTFDSIFTFIPQYARDGLRKLYGAYDLSLEEDMVTEDAPLEHTDHGALPALLPGRYPESGKDRDQDCGGHRPDTNPPLLINSRDGPTQDPSPTANHR